MLIQELQRLCIPLSLCHRVLVICEYFFFYLLVCFFKIGGTEMVGISITYYLLQERGGFYRSLCSKNTCRYDLNEFRVRQIHIHECFHYLHTFFFMMLGSSKQMTSIMKPGGNVYSQHVLL